MSPTAYTEKFGKTPIFGMIHLAGDNPIDQAMAEVNTFTQHQVDGIIVENYHGSIQDVVHALREIKITAQNIMVGINILPNDFRKSFELAEEYNADFIQLDHVAGSYDHGSINVKDYLQVREKHPTISVFGGVWPKYYTPTSGSNIENDLQQGVERADAIVVTGEGTGQQTPIEKIELFRQTIGEEHPLIIGAGLTPDNAYDQLLLSHGAIVGSTFKPNGDTCKLVDPSKVQDFMQVVQEVRQKKK